MAVGLSTVTGLTAQQNVTEEHRPGREHALTLLLPTEEQTVRERTSRLRNVTQTNVQVRYDLVLSRLIKCGGIEMIDLEN